VRWPLRLLYVHLLDLPSGEIRSLTSTIYTDIYKNGSPQDEVNLGDPDNFVDEGDRYRLNYGSTGGHENACDGHYM